MRPCDTSQRGDSGITRRAYSAKSALTAPNISVTRQPAALSAKAVRKRIPASPAAMPPNAQKFITVALVRPRWRAGTNSAIAEATTECSPPTPRPVTKRKKSSDSKFQESAVSIANVE